MNAISAHEPIRWGVLGAGNIANRFCASLEADPADKLVAISGRSEERLAAFREDHPCDNVYLDHAQLLADDNVDAIYLALPHGLHHQWAMAALEAGRAVLSEKPACLTAAQVRDVVACATEHDVAYMEGMKCRFVPCHDKVMAAVSDPSLGGVTGVSASFCRDFPYIPGRYLFDLEQGGLLWDMGCYLISWVDELSQGPVGVANAKATFFKGVDWHEDVTLTIGRDGREVPFSFTCAGDGFSPALMTIELAGGTIEVPDMHRPTTATLTRTDGSVTSLDAPYDIDDFHSEIAHFDAMLHEGRIESDIMPFADSIAMADTMDRIRAAWGDPRS